ncbi:VID27 cytoplasmic protein-domain-containing protein [Amylocarpus encephaloides]|uniref:VID27 cytoplasmic protein-domain-containing protein n=1 Tax=Amylocarpus encephaloides TaxID=45428 RepID=A0A9P8C3A0_9HELO|nr:VID27 cytoplasmic protein-domain-containing protein [Amylocarpus encephaloides]
MFVLRNVGKLIFGDTSKESLIEIPQGQLYIVRPLSPKGYSELIFKDAAARIRKTNQEFQYQLVIQRAYEEGEEDLLDEEDGEDAESAALAAERDEKTFLLDEALHFRSESRRGEKVLAWRDLSGDTGDLYEFVCDASTDDAQVQGFELTAIRCQYERKQRKSHTTATTQELGQFTFVDEPPIPSPVHSPTRSPEPLIPVQAMPLNTRSTANSALKREITPQKSRAAREETPRKEDGPTAAPPVAGHPEATSVLAEEVGELHLFDFQSGAFILQDSAVKASIFEVGNWRYWLKIKSQNRDWLGQEIVADINPVFNFEFLSCIFNAYTADGAAYSWLLRYPDEATLLRFQEGLMQALWEQLNELKWNKAKDDDRDYVLGAFQDLVLDDAPEGEEEEEEEEHEAEEVEDDAQKSEKYDSDEEEDDVVTRDDDGNVNSQLAVGYTNDRSFVARGSKIGVFKHTHNNHLEFSTNISRVETPGGKLFAPKKMMLHMEDRNMILQNEGDPNSLFRMDLEYGKIVDEWKVHDDIAINTFAPESKFSQTTGEQTFLGLSRNALYRVDPRLAGNKLVDSELKQYASKNDFSAAATTEKGYIAVASNKGDIRMFDRLGINAKTHIPALGEPIIGLDVSADGRWVLATCRTYLLFIDALQRTGKNEGKLGFEKSFGKDSKPQPRRLGLTPSHVAQFQHETGAPLAFTPARFNTGEGLSETSIITATGPFVVTWSMKKVLRGSKDSYSIKRYSDIVQADNFRYGDDKNAVVALPHEVNMVSRADIKKPTRESIAPASLLRRSDAGRIGNRQSARYKLGKDDIVNSPY